MLIGDFLKKQFVFCSKGIGYGQLQIFSHNSVIAWLLKHECYFVSMVGCLTFLEHILYFKENYEFKVKALSLPHTGDEGEAKFSKKIKFKLIC